MKALVINCALGKFPEPARTESPTAAVVVTRFSEHEVEKETVHALNLDSPPARALKVSGRREAPR
ncbi:hypothetical protein [Streptomyces sp. NPDC059468]|uniref:hypothetical protein n=1 Tax=unclassified Streptomyces TaxID=2593676 RepID=UPI00367439DA